MSQRGFRLTKELLNQTDLDKCRKKVVVQDIVAHILYPKPHIKLTGTLDQSNQFCLNTVMCFADNNKGVSCELLLGIINSRFLSFYYYYFIFNQAIRTMHFMPGYSDIIPIPNDYKLHQGGIEKQVQIMLSKNKDLQQVKQHLQQLFLGKYSGLKLNNKLSNWPALSFNEFLKELNKQKIKLSLPEEAEWLNYFGGQKTIANNIEKEIAATDKEIDQMVYALYGLTQEEVRIVEG